MNALLESNQQIIERARTQVGNLAHALKTPLSVITNEARAGSGPLAEKVAEQAEIMRMQVNHYLDRAQIAARSKVIGAVTEVDPAVASLVRAMRRIHEDRGLELTVEVARGGAVPRREAGSRGNRRQPGRQCLQMGEDRRSPSRSTTSRRAARTAAASTLLIDDDGPGLTAEQREQATRRGRRLDETKPGSGLGLSIVTELVQLYERIARARPLAAGRAAGRGDAAGGVSAKNLNSAIVTWDERRPKG